jgi:hypothetical protein
MGTECQEVLIFDEHGIGGDGDWAKDYYRRVEH